MEVKDDLSSLQPLEFWNEIKLRHWVYLTENTGDLARQAPNFSEIHDNPNRYHASPLALKVATESEKEQLK